MIKHSDIRKGDDPTHSVITNVFCHYQCGRCGTWWANLDAAPIEDENISLFCPQCGTYGWVARNGE